MKPIALTLTIILAWTGVAAAADQPLAPPNWTRAEALEAVSRIDLNAELKPLFELARRGDDVALGEALNRLASRADLAAPARDRILFEFAAGLGDLPPGSVGQAAFDWLAAYEVATQVPHLDYPLAGVPLYNVGAAAAGSKNRWAYKAAVSQSRKLLTSSSAAWLAAYARSEPAARKGFIEALDRGGEAELKALADGAFEALPAQPALTPVVLRSSILLADSGLFSQALAVGSGPGIVHELRRASARFGDDEVFEILQHSIRHAPAPSAALAIAELAPARLEQSAYSELLFETMAKRDTGSAAALILSASPDPAIRSRLKAMAEQQDGLASRRASIALQAPASPDKGGAL